MSAESVSVALIGMGGYGEAYLRELLKSDRNGLRFVAAADLDPSRCTQLSAIQDAGIPVYQSQEALQAETKADLVVLATPPQFHCEQACAALAHGSSVLSEKPLGCEPGQIWRMRDARDRAARQVAIGYQWSFSPAIQRLKQDISAGRFGTPLRFKTTVYWPRDERYYLRNNWAGRQRDAQGRPVLDSPVNNACAHYLHNMFFVLGERLDRSAQPEWVTAELYRANPIENYDTGILRCQTRGGVEMLFIATHAAGMRKEPMFRYEFEKAAICHGGADRDEIVARFADGSSVSYGRPDRADSAEKMLDVSRALLDNRPVACGLEAAAAQTLAMYAAQQSMPQISDFPKDFIVVEGQPGTRRTHVRDLEQVLDRCYDEFKMPSEIGTAWARQGKKIHVEKKVTD